MFLRYFTTSVTVEYTLEPYEKLRTKHKRRPHRGPRSVGNSRHSRRHIYPFPRCVLQHVQRCSREICRAPDFGAFVLLSLLLLFFCVGSPLVWERGNEVGRDIRSWKIMKTAKQIHLRFFRVSTTESDARPFYYPGKFTDERRRVYIRYSVFLLRSKLLYVIKDLYYSVRISHLVYGRKKPR